MGLSSEMTLLMSFALSMGLISSFRPARSSTEWSRGMKELHSNWIFLRFWADAISTACYISNWIFLRSILHLVPFEFCFGRKPSVSHFMPFGCKCFVLKFGNLDKSESCSFDDILFEYTPHDRSYRVYNFETNTVVESYDVTFDETAPCPHGVFECAGDKEIEESIFVDEGL
jgi:hypothetical protein